MELKKPANPWEMLPGAPNPQATKTLASAIRIDVAAGPESKPDKSPQLPAAPPRLTPRSADRAQTPLPTRRQLSPGRQFLSA